MIVRHFLLWARNAPPEHRAEAVAALAAAYVGTGLDPDDSWEAETALTTMLDDASPLVRLAMAEGLASSERAPVHVIGALAADRSDIAEIVLARSPVLLDCDLVDAAALGDGRLQCAIAGRPWVSEPVAAALAEIGLPEALKVLVLNAGAEIAPAALCRIVDRHGGDVRVREALLSRTDLPVDVAQALATALADQLGAFVVKSGWMNTERSERLVHDTRERATIALSAQASRDDVARLVSHLRRMGQLTPALILRALLSEDAAFAEAAVAELAMASDRRVSAAFRDRSRYGFRALYAKASLPISLRPVFESLLESRKISPREFPDRDARLSRRMVERALAACRAVPEAHSGRLAALLRRFEVEATLEEARSISGELADEAALSMLMQHAPEALSAFDEELERLAA